MPQLPLEYAFSASLVCSRVPPTQGGSKTTDHVSISRESRSPRIAHSTNRSTCHVSSTVLGTEATVVNKVQCREGEGGVNKRASEYIFQGALSTMEN